MTKQRRKRDITCSCGAKFNSWGRLKNHKKKYNCGNPYQLILEEFGMNELKNQPYLRIRYESSLRR